MIALHASAAIAALLLGAGVLRLRKGTRVHKVLGRSWVAVMLAVVLSSFWITREGSFSWIHALSVWTLVSLACAIYFIRRGDVRTHKYFMAGTFMGLAGAGLGALAPGRLLHLLLFA